MIDMLEVWDDLTFAPRLHPYLNNTLTTNLRWQLGQVGTKAQVGQLHLFNMTLLFVNMYLAPVYSVTSTCIRSTICPDLL